MKWLLPVCVILLSGCAGLSDRTSLVVIGNSITRHGPVPDSGWLGDWGMAAPTVEKDFSHIVAATLNVPVSINNLGIEQSQGPSPEIPPYKITPSTIVILELGDNARGDVANFASAYNQLAAGTSKGKTLLCLSTFWNYADIDEVIKLACETHHGHYVFIGDIFTDPANPDRQSTAYSDWQVNIHPQEWGHRQIAERALAQLAH